jgi:predicted MFS family arabinose efflux permease
VLDTSRILEKIGLYRFTLYVLIIEFLCTLGLAVTKSPLLVAIYFTVHTITIAMLLFNMDVYVESVSKDKSIVGEIRATYLTIANATIVLAPIFIALIVTDSVYSYIYLLSSISILPLYFLIKKFNDVEYKPVAHMQIRQAVMDYMKDVDLYNVFVAQFILQLFYAFMIVYTPLYLQKYIGFSWSEIGVIFTIMLLPFILFELPVGELSDSKYGEKEFMTIGFVIMGLSTLFISFITVKIFWMWAAILFITRIGASFVEISVETYFFKKVDDTKTNVVSLFRVARPISFIIAPILATIAFQFIEFQYIFILIGLAMIFGTRYSMALNDTK